MIIRMRTTHQNRCTLPSLEENKHSNSKWICCLCVLLSLPSKSVAVSWESSSSLDSMASRKDDAFSFSRARLVLPMELKEDKIDEKAEESIAQAYADDPLGLSPPPRVVPLESSSSRRNDDEALQVAWARQHSKGDNTKIGTDPAAHFLSTGTTIVGVSGRDFVVLAADTRATAGRLVADQRAAKLHPLARNAAAAGAGTSADLEAVTRQARFQARLEACLAHTGNGDTSDDEDKASTEATVSVSRLCKSLQEVLYQQGGSCQANLIVGGVSSDGQAILRAIHPHGSMDRVVYTALGSGGLAAMSILESRFRTDLTVAQAKELAMQAIVAGIENDLGSGSQVDVCVIGADGVAHYTRSAVPEEELPIHTAVKEREGAKDQNASETTANTQGVNGFGNVPFAIQSQRVVRVNRASRETQRLEAWEDLVGSAK